MQIKRVIADIKIEWRADDGKSSGSLSFGVESDKPCGLAELPSVLAAALAVPVASMVPPAPVVVPAAKPEAKPEPEAPAPLVRVEAPADIPAAKPSYLKRKPRA